MVVLDHWVGSRKNLLSVGPEYHSVKSAFSGYIVDAVRPGDMVVISSAPPNTIELAKKIRRQGATSVYWLQDYYPELLRGLWEYPRALQKGLARYWNYHLGVWDHVVKVAGNLGYDGPNAQVIRNWPTVQFSGKVEPIPRTALYAGNFGYCQHLPTFLNCCRRLFEDGYHITVQGDGPGIEKMPDWIETRPPLRNEDELIRSYQLADVHIIAAHPDIQRAVFPSKVWNSLASGRRLLFAGFGGSMACELQASLQADYSRHLMQWKLFLGKLYDSTSAESGFSLVVNTG